jgi:hypothetical protein
MDLTKILSITGKPGLYKSLSQSKTGFIVESLIDGKRFTAFTSEKISTLEEISIYTSGDDIPLKDVFKSIFEKNNGEPAISHLSSPEELTAFFEEIMPDYDKERVYVSHIKKIVNWYNTLLEHKMIEFKEEEKKEEEEEAVPVPEEATSAEKPVKPEKKPKAVKATATAAKKTRTKKEKSE